MGNSIYERYIQEGRNQFLVDLVNQGHRNTWLLKRITTELETIATPPATKAVKAVVPTLPPGAKTSEEKPEHLATTYAKINTFNLPPHLQKLYNEAKDIFRTTAATHNELAVDVYQQSNLISQKERGIKITEVVEGRAKAIAIFDRCRVWEQTGVDPGGDEKPALDETNAHAVLKKIQSLRSSISRFKSTENKVKEAAAQQELERLEEIYKGLTNV